MIEIRHKNMEDSKATREAYEQIYQEDDILLKNSFYLWLLNLLKPQRGRILVDVSCGHGRLVALAQHRGIEAIGIDFARKSVLKGISESPKSGWAVGDGECLPLKESSADYVTHIGSLEHYINPEIGVREITRILKEDGSACILLPNAFGLFGNIKHVWSTGDIFDDGQPVQRYGTRRFWESLLTENGLRVKKVYGYGEVEFPRTFHDAFQLLIRPRKILRFSMQLVIPLNLKNHLVFICSRG